MLFEVLPDPRALVAAKGTAAALVLQIHRPIPESVPVGHFEEGGVEVVDETVGRSVYLDRIRQACAALGEQLEVRFYDHFEDEFDASVLDHLPEIRCLSLDGLPRLRHPQAVGRLPSHLYSVPRLQAVKGFSGLPAAKSLFAYDSRLDLPWSELPPTLTHFQLVTKTVKGRKAHDAQVRANGLTPTVHPEAVFFYK